MHVLRECGWCVCAVLAWSVVTRVVPPPWCTAQWPLGSQRPGPQLFRMGGLCVGWGLGGGRCGTTERGVGSSEPGVQEAEGKLLLKGSLFMWT